jgi:hypothetical protein
LDNTPLPVKSKTKKEWHMPRMVEVFYPLKISSTQDRHNWIKAMMLDARLGDRDKTVLTRLALHLNLKTGRCDPTLDLLALETSLPGSEQSARRMVRRCLERADELGWIERTGRHSGSRLNRSNSYRLTIPKDIRPDKFDTSSGQIEGVVRTPESGRIGKVNREGEYSVYSIQPAPVADAPVAPQNSQGKRESERVPVAPIHRKSTSFKEAILRVESIIAPEVPREK